MPNMKDPTSYLHISTYSKQSYYPIHEKKYDPETDKFKPKKRVFTVWLLYVDEPDWKMYWCPDCRKPVMQYKGDLIMEHPGIDADGTYIKPVAPPILIQCKNERCGRKFMFQGTVKRA